MILKSNKGTALARLGVMISCLGLPAGAAEAESAMMAYSRSGGGGMPRYRTWTGTVWSSEASANGVGSEPQWLILRGSPLTDSFAMATLDNDVDIDVQIWNGSSWGAVTNATTDCGDKTSRVFDLAYEQVSGHLLLVYRESGTNSVSYRTYDGMIWSAEQSLVMTAGNLIWLSLTARSGTDEILLVAQSSDSSDHTRAAIWNGSSFTNVSSSAGSPPMHGCYQRNSG